MKNNEWDGKDWCWANIGFGIAIAVILLGFGGCIHLVPFAR